MSGTSEMGGWCGHCRTVMDVGTTADGARRAVSSVRAAAVPSPALPHTRPARCHCAPADHARTIASRNDSSYGYHAEGLIR